jgi:hypothetical protein
MDKNEQVFLAAFYSMKLLLLYELVVWPKLANWTPQD